MIGHVVDPPAQEGTETRRLPPDQRRGQDVLRQRGPAPWNYGARPGRGPRPSATGTPAAAPPAATARSADPPRPTAARTRGSVRGRKGGTVAHMDAHPFRPARV